MFLPQEHALQPLYCSRHVILSVTICLPRKAENPWVVLIAAPFPEEPLTNGSRSISPRTNTYCRPPGQMLPHKSVRGTEPPTVVWSQTQLPLPPQAQDR